MSMTRTALLDIFKEIVCETAEKAYPKQAEELETLKKNLEAGLNPESPLNSLGWDSMQMTWLLVRLEERFNIDTSSLMIFDLFTVGDLLDEIQKLISQH